MYVDVNTVITAASLLAAIGAIFSVIFAVYRWYLRQNRQDTEIEKFVKALNDAGYQDILNAKQEQLDAWAAQQK